MTAQKTPISLMNELCKSNNIAPAYDVVEESGPPHEKTFKVQLTLENIGTYNGSAKTIKGAKHKAAELGLENSGLSKPVRKPKLTELRPSVELNSLAMKLGRLVQYQDLPYGGNKHAGPSPVPSNAYSQYGGQFKRYTPGMPYGRPPIKMTVSVKVGDKEYFGEGFKRKQARHNAAQNALNDLLKEVDVGKSEENAIQDPPIKKETSSPVENGANSADIKPIKSEISQVYEIASRQKLKIDFDVISSTGPPHNRMFVTTVTVGEFKATGEGPSKKVSKREASVKILADLMKLAPPPSPAKSPSPKGRLFNHGGYNKKTVKELDPSLNPVSLLGQLRQRRKESLPVYTLVAEEGVRNKEFTIQVVVDTHTAKGSGANKKEAKKNAAEAMLILLGIRANKSASNDEVEVNNSDTQDQKGNQEDEKTSDKESEVRQLPPGLLPILPEMASRPTPPAHSMPPQTKTIVSHSPPVNNFTNASDSVQAKQSGPTITVLNRAPGAPVGKPLSDEILQNGSTPSMKKLEQLAEASGFQVHYQDSTQENDQYLAVVTVSTVPQLICRGYGSTLDQAFEHAAANALVPLLQPPPNNGQVTNGNGQRSMHQPGEEST